MLLKSVRVPLSFPSLFFQHRQHLRRHHRALTAAQVAAVQQKTPHSGGVVSVVVRLGSLYFARVALIASVVRARASPMASMLGLL